MRVTKRFKPEELELNMSPMIDVVFLLIMFFLVVSEIATYDRIEDLTLPNASEAKAEDVMPDRLIISVDTNNQIFIAGQRLNLDGVEHYLRIERQLRRSGSGKTAQPGLIQADRNAKWRVIQDIIERANKCKFWRLSFSAKKVVP